jgi:hypothetical protein
MLIVEYRCSAPGCSSTHPALGERTACGGLKVDPPGAWTTVMQAGEPLHLCSLACLRATLGAIEKRAGEREELAKWELRRGAQTAQVA